MSFSLTRETSSQTTEKLYQLYFKQIAHIGISEEGGGT